MSPRTVFELILLAALWGASFLFMRVATPEFGAIALIEIRVLLAGLFLLPFWLHREPVHMRRAAYAHGWPIMVVGALNSAVPFVLFAYSTLYITGGFAAILNATAPIWAAVVAWLWLRKPLALPGVLGLSIGLAGVVVLVSDTVRLELGNQSLGALAALTAPILYGIAANYTSEKLADVSPLAITTLSQLGAAILLLPLCLVFWPAGAITVQAWVSLVALAILCTSLAYLLYFRLIAQVGSTQAITVTFLIPVFGMLWGALFIGEQITLRMVIGTAIILLGTALVTGVLTYKRRSRAA